jgi:hypothetical protein
MMASDTVRFRFVESGTWTVQDSPRGIICQKQGPEEQNISVRIRTDLGICL